MSKVERCGNYGSGMVRSFAKPDKYISCPSCQAADFRVDHLKEGYKTAWYCDECGVRFSVLILSAGLVDTELINGERKERRVVTLVSSGPVTLELNTFVLVPNRNEETVAEYFYNEGACPVNFMKDVSKVIDSSGDEDPHGVFKFVSIRKLEPERPTDCINPGSQLTVAELYDRIVEGMRK